MANNIPRHIFVTPDGNGRWAIRKRLSGLFGHSEGVLRFHEIADAAFRLNIPYFTFWALSADNFLKRELAPVFNETDLANIEKFHVYVKTIVNNEPVPAFSMSLEKDIETVKARMNPKLAEMIKQLSRLKYGRDKELVEAEMIKRSKL